MCPWDFYVQADGAQSSRVTISLPEDPYEAIRHAYLDGTDTKSEPFEDPVDIETPESPLTIAPPTSPSESAPPVLVPILRRTARMAVRVPLVLSSGLYASMAEVAAMLESAFRKRFRSSYESSPSLSPSDLPSRKRYRGTSELVVDSEEDDDDEDEETEESMDSDSVSKDAEDEGPTAEDKDPAAGDEGLTAGVESLGMDDESYSLDDNGHGVESDGIGLEEEKEEAVPRGQQQAAPVVGTAGSGSAPEFERPERVSTSRQPTLTTWIDPEDGMVYIDVPAYPPIAPPVQTPPLPEWRSGSLPISPSPSVVEEEEEEEAVPRGQQEASSVTPPLPEWRSGSLPISPSPSVVPPPLTVPSPVATPAAELSPALFERSLEYKQERVAVTFESIWRPVLALESWVGQTDAQRAALWHVISDVPG
ncbi:hypothetical protein Tco_1314493 [Tanacetum coccineum]